MNISLYISCIYKILTNELHNIMSYQGAIKIGCKYVREDGAALLGFTKIPRSSSSFTWRDCILTKSGKHSEQLAYNYGNLSLDISQKIQETCVWRVFYPNSTSLHVQCEIYLDAWLSDISSPHPHKGQGISSVSYTPENQHGS